MIDNSNTVATHNSSDEDKRKATFVRNRVQDNDEIEQAIQEVGIDLDDAKEWVVTGNTLVSATDFVWKDVVKEGK